MIFNLYFLIFGCAFSFFKRLNSYKPWSLGKDDDKLDYIDMLIDEKLFYIFIHISIDLFYFIFYFNLLSMVGCFEKAIYQYETTAQ